MRTKTWLVAVGLIGLLSLSPQWTANAWAQDTDDDDGGGNLEGNILGPPGGYPAGDRKELGPPTGGYPAGEGPAIPRGSTGGYPAGEGPALPRGSTGGYPAGEGPALPRASTGGYPAGEGRLPGARNGGADDRAPLGEDGDEDDE